MKKEKIADESKNRSIVSVSTLQELGSQMMDSIFISLESSFGHPLGHLLHSLTYLWVFFENSRAHLRFIQMFAHVS